MKLYVGKVAQLCGHFRFSEEVEATAVSYLKRFYLKNTVMDWHPKNVMCVTSMIYFPIICKSFDPFSLRMYRLTALFLAAKTTNNPISLDDYTSHIPKTVPADVLDLEFLVAQSLGFEFSVWHAHRALWGVRLDIEVRPFFVIHIIRENTLLKMGGTAFPQTLPDAQAEKLDALYDDALKHVRASRLTDAELIYAPAQIALAAFALASPALAEKWAVTKGHGLLMGDVIPRIQEMIVREGVGPDVEVVREVDRRLRICKNPEKVKGSKAWLKKEKEAEEGAREKRARKAEEARRAMEADDPFGGHLDGAQGEKQIDDDDDDD